MNRTFYHLIPVLFAIIIASPALAQQQGETDESLLPEIDPQDIEIRSEFKARFPGLRRQPILGFDPTPRTYQVDPNRTPFMETGRQIVANLPVSELSRPEPPAYTPLHYSSDINAFSRIGVGSFISSQVQFWGVTRLSSSSYVGGDLNFSSAADGHLDNQESTFRFFDANAEYATKIDSKTKFTLTAGGQSDFNYLFDPNTTQYSVPDSPRKNYNGAYAGGEVERFRNSIEGWKIQANVRYFDTELLSGELSGQIDETVFNGSFSKRWAGANVDETFTVKAGAKGGSYSNTQFSDEWLTAQGGLQYQRLFNYSTEVTAEASVYYGSSGLKNGVYFAPSVEVEHPLLDIFSVKGKIAAYPYLKTLEQQHESNRFLNAATLLQHSYTIDALAEASLHFTDIGAINFGLEYENTSDYPLMIREEAAAGVGAGTEYLFYETTYADINIIKAFANATHQVVPERFWLTGEVYVQSPKLDGGGDMPFKEKFGASAGLNLRPFSQMSIEAWVDYVGPRQTMATNSELEGFILLGSQLDIQISERFGAYAKLVNLLSQEYQIWEGYTERPFQAFGGVTVKL